MLIRPDPTKMNKGMMNKIKFSMVIDEVEGYITRIPS
jgi:hypothetical protein